MNAFKRLLADERGATAVEYGIVAALVSVAGAAAMGRLGVSAATMFGTIGVLLNVFGGASET